MCPKVASMRIASGNPQLLLVKNGEGDRWSRRKRDFALNKTSIINMFAIR